MILYDITTNKTLPDRLIGVTNNLIIRCLYDQNGIISMLTYMHKDDGVHLIVFSTPGYTTAPVPNPIYHIDAVSQNPQIYANFLNTNKFIIEYTKSKYAEPIQRRLPDWTFVGFTKDGHPRLELTLTE